MQALVEQSDSLLRATNIGVFWPVHRYESMEKKAPPAAATIRLDANQSGKPIPGVIRDSVHGNPIGASLLTHQLSVNIKKQRIAADSAHDLRDGQTEDTWKQMQVDFGRSMLQTKQKDDPDDEHGTLIATLPPMAKKKKKDSDDDSSCFSDDVAWLPGLFSNAGKKRGAGGAGSAGGAKRAAEGDELSAA